MSVLEETVEEKHDTQQDCGGKDDGCGEEMGHVEIETGELSGRYANLLIHTPTEGTVTQTSHGQF